MKKLHKLFIMLMLAMLAVACSDDDDATSDPAITITTSEFTITAEQGSQAKALFNINVDWTASISYEGEAKDWLTAAPTSGGAGDVEIIMKATENLSTTERKAFVIINYEGGSHKLTVSQLPSKTTDITAYFDAKFAAKLQEKKYIPDAKKILLSDVINITEINVSGTDLAKGELTSLAGIEYFKSLTNLNCSKNQLTILDISKNTELTYLNCDYNKLTTLDVGKNIVLTSLNCYDNQLATLDVSKNTALTYLNYAFNQLTTLDVSKNTALTYLSCHNNQLTTLDVSKNTVLTNFYCDYNQLTMLDISKNTALTNFYCHYNQLTMLDISKNIALTELYCNANELTILDISKNTALTRFDCSGNPGIGSTFVVKAWFDNNNNPSSNFSYGSWDYDGRSIAIDYQKVKL